MIAVGLVLLCVIALIVIFVRESFIRSAEARAEFDDGQYEWYGDDE